MTINLNSFGLSTAKGKIFDQTKGERIECRIDATELSTLVPGDFVTLALTSTPTIDVTKALNTSSMLGCVFYDSARKNTYVAGDTLTIASSLTRLKLEAASAISRGAKVEYVPTGAKVQTASAGTVIGFALTQAKQAGDLIDVVLTAMPTA